MRKGRDTTHEKVELRRWTSGKRNREKEMNLLRMSRESTGGPGRFFGKNWRDLTQSTGKTQEGLVVYTFVLYY